MEQPSEMRKIIHEIHIKSKFSRESYGDGPNIIMNKFKRGLEAYALVVEKGN